jgi:hypothetical protein
MDARIERLEGKVDKLDDRFRGVEITLATLTERVSHLPSKGFIVSALITSLVVVAGLIVFADSVKALLTG